MEDWRGRLHIMGKEIKRKLTRTNEGNNVVELVVGDDKCTGLETEV